MIFVNRHNVIWWKTRCIALEHENNVLKNTIRSLVNQSNNQHFSKNADSEELDLVDDENTIDEEEKLDEDSIEFNLNEDMMTFLAQSMEHKIALKNKRESQVTTNELKLDHDYEAIEGGQAWFHKRDKDAKLLYGEASSRVLAMETALQTTIERHKMKAKPQYWPNIPLKL